MKRGWASVLVIAALVPARVSPAFADDEPAAEPSAADIDEARRLFREAVAREDAGDHQGALALYAKARTHAVSPQLLFNMASCAERLERLVEAARTFRDAEAESLKRGNEEVLRETRTRIQRLSTLIPRLVVKLPAGMEGIEVQVDAHALEIVAGEPVLLDPGEHRIVARAPDGAVFDFSFPMAPGDARTVDVSFAKSTPGEAPKIDLRPRPAGPRPSLVPAAIAGGAAVVLGTASIVTFAIGRSKKNEYIELNDAPTDENRSRREDLKSEGESLYLGSTVLGIAAAASAGVGIYFLVRAVTAKPAVATRWIVPTTSGLAVGGTL